MTTEPVGTRFLLTEKSATRPEDRRLTPEGIAWERKKKKEVIPLRGLLHLFELGLMRKRFQHHLQHKSPVK